jgi:hypothetical protein
MADDKTNALREVERIAKAWAATPESSTGAKTYLTGRYDGVRLCGEALLRALPPSPSSDTEAGR